MPEAKPGIAELLIGYLTNDLTIREREELDREVEQSAINRLIFNEFNDPKVVAQELERYESVDEDAIWASVLKKHTFRNKKPAPVKNVARIRKIWWIAGRASAIAAAIIIAFGIYFYITRPKEVVAEKKQEPVPSNKDIGPTLKHVPDSLVGDTAHIPSKKANTTDIAPGSYGAILTSGNGSASHLNLSSSGSISNRDSVNIAVHKGELSYKSNHGINPTVPVYNTLHVPIANMFRVRLPDGTLVWLNASSSLRYPVSFTGKERRVELTGEGYFEVAKNAKMPFIVSVNRTEIEVIGTTFNVNAYSDEDTLKTTLLEGTIKLSNNGITRTLNEGMQANIVAGNMQISKANARKALAWKNGSFDINDEDIDAVMRKIAKWYNVTFSIAADVPTDTFRGEISRDRTLLDVIHIINGKGNIRVELIDRKVLISKLK